jgi:hypothetical protein
MFIAWFMFCLSNKVIALKKVNGRMMCKHNPDDDGKHITEFKKSKSAKNRQASQQSQ